MSGGSAPAPAPVAPTMQEMQMAKNAREQNNLYMELYAPAEQRVLNDMRATQARRDLAQGQVATDFSSQFSPVAANVNRTAALSGVMGAGRGAMALGEAYNALKSSRAGGRAQTDLNSTQQELAGLQKMTAFGRNLGNDQILGLQQAANTATKAGISGLNTSLQNRATTIKSNLAGMELAGQGLGAISGGIYFAGEKGLLGKGYQEKGLLGVFGNSKGNSSGGGEG